MKFSILHICDMLIDTKKKKYCGTTRNRIKNRINRRNKVTKNDSLTFYGFIES